MVNRKGTEMQKATIALTRQQVDLLRGVLYEYYDKNEYHEPIEKTLHREVEGILADAEDSFCSTLAR